MYYNSSSFQTLLGKVVKWMPIKHFTWAMMYLNRDYGHRSDYGSPKNQYNTAQRTLTGNNLLLLYTWYGYHVTFQNPILGVTGKPRGLVLRIRDTTNNVHGRPWLIIQLWIGSPIISYLSPYRAWRIDGQTDGRTDNGIGWFLWYRFILCWIISYTGRYSTQIRWILFVYCAA